MDSSWQSSLDESELLRLVAEGVAFPPEWVLAAGQAAYDWLSVDADLLALLTQADQPDRPRPI